MHPSGSDIANFMILLINLQVPTCVNRLTKINEMKDVLELCDEISDNLYGKIIESHNDISFG